MLRNLSVRATLLLILGLLAMTTISVVMMDVLSGFRRTMVLEKAGRSGRAGRDLIEALSDARTERGNLNGLLNAAGRAGVYDQDQTILARTASEHALEQALMELKGSDVDGIGAALETLQKARLPLAELRRQADDAVQLPLDARPPTLMRAWPDITQTYIDSLCAVTDIVDQTIEMADPMMAHYLSIKRAAWTARLSFGGYGFRVVGALAARRAWTAAESAGSREDHDRAMDSWEIISHATSRSDTPAALQQSVARAATNFIGSSAKEDQLLIDTLSSGHVPDVELSDVLKRYGSNAPLITKVSVDAADLMVAEAHSRVVAARKSLAVDVGLLIMVSLLTGCGIVFVLRRVIQPLASITGNMAQLAAGDLTVPVPFLERHDEIGAMAAAVQVFKEGMIRKVELEQAACDRLAEQAEAVAGLAAGLAMLSVGDLTAEIRTVFARNYEPVRRDFNQAVRQLQAAMGEVSANTSTLRSGAIEFTQAADDLSCRTERQAATLEETAAALNLITATVQKTAGGAKQVLDAVFRTRENAEHSGVTVGKAVTAMASIRTSSEQIGQIIGVIDGLAARTNLLALNAGIEAARAGESGRGFAVVASEVRALAQRSASAAQEIKSLIATSAHHVGTGARLVSETGVALDQIVEQVAEINRAVSEIAASAVEQASGLAHINTAINQMDQVTQQNAAMVEESTAASHSLAQEADALLGLTRRFTLGQPVGRIVA